MHWNLNVNLYGVFEIFLCNNFDKRLHKISEVKKTTISVEKNIPNFNK